MEHPPELPEDMAAVVASSPPPPQQQPQSGPKRYRPAPAKTFQCRGYGECRMVFSRSEHLARHIRKHTGERPFTCHCSKQFSRLDNLRQHAQTVHADKQEQNERMMRELTSLHASMAAANKLATVRNPRRNAPSHAAPVKQEDLSHPLHQRPGTSTGYEGDHDSFLYSQQYTHSFRDSNQSFLGPPAAGAAPGQSFLPFASSLGFGVSDPARDARPRTSSSRPPTAGGLADPSSRSLPPLSAVVSASLSNSPRQQLIQPFPAPTASSHGQSGGGSLLLPGSLTLRRPTTATRPGTAPASASLYSAKPPFTGGSGLGFSRPPDLSLQSYGSSGRPSSSLLGPPSASSHYDAEPPSPGNDASPFFFSPPSIDPPVASTTATSPASINARKRPFPGSDGPYDDPTSSRESASQQQQQHDYEYGSESRPQSRRLSVMELCNDSDDNPSSGSPVTFLLSSSTRPAAAESRPTTSGLISSASALALVDRPSPTLPSPSIQPRPSSQYPTTNSRGNGSSGNGRSSEEEFGGDRVSTPTAFRRTSGIPASTTTILPSYRTTGGSGGYYYTYPPTTTATFSTGAPSAAASFSPRSERASASGSVSPFSPRSPLSSGTADPASPISRRSAHGGSSSDDDQIRDRFASRTSHPSPALGLRA
ncbi:Biofilm and cell wall regulator 1 [Leucoagaricus sp. SymC.cos]|nr:Biofilm and cell wall regulator 1 [Leucoagaricus sp. SymC.cos]